MLVFNSFFSSFCHVRLLDLYCWSISLLLSDLNFHLHPSHATEGVLRSFFVSHLIKFTSNQLLIFSNFKNFYSSSTEFIDKIITLSHCHQSLLVVVEVNLDDRRLILLDYGLNGGDLLGWVEDVTKSEFIISSLACLTIT